MSLPRPLGKRVLIKPIEKEDIRENGVFVGTSEDYMPQAEILAISKDLEKDFEVLYKGEEHLKVGDVVYYIHNSRQPGKVRAEESDHFVVGIDQIAAIV